VVLVFVLAILGAMILSQSHSAYAGGPVTVRVSIFSNQSMQIVVPASSNLTLLSLRGEQYNVGVTYGPRTNVLTFSPSSSNGTYSMLVNVSSPSPTNVLVMQTSGGVQTLAKNVTSGDSILLNLSVSVSPEINSGPSWNPLSGFIGLGLSFGGLSLDTTDIFAIFLGISLLVIGLGVKFSQKFVFVGLSFLSLVGVAAVGILGVGLVLGLYVLSFFAVKSCYSKAYKSETS
jgi:hypothetical protein